jgi:hypothetical protein
MKEEDEKINQEQLDQINQEIEFLVEKLNKEIVEFLNHVGVNVPNDKSFTQSKNLSESNK